MNPLTLTDVVRVMKMRSELNWMEENWKKITKTVTKKKKKKKKKKKERKRVVKKDERKKEKRCEMWNSSKG